MANRLVSLIGVAGAAALAIGAVRIADTTLAGRQLDLTEQRLYTLSPGTRQVLATLHDPITLRLFYSPELGARIPQYAAHAARVQEMLRSFAELSHGRIRLDFINPEPYSAAEDRAAGYGLQGVPLEQGGQKVFFGLEGNNLLDDERSIAFFQPERERFLEVDLTRLMIELSAPRRATVGVMSDLPLDGDPQAALQGKPAAAPWATMLDLRRSFDIRRIPTDATAIDPDTQVLLVANPQNLPEKTLYAIDQFVMRGGRLMAMVSPNNETSVPPAPPGSDLARLFRAWGIDYDPNQAVGDLTGAWKVRAGANDAPTDYVAYFSIHDGIAHDDAATADLHEIVVADPGFLTVTATSPLTITPLLETSDQSALLPATAIIEPDPAKILQTFKPDGQHRIIAARLRGELPSAFPIPPEGAPGPHLAKTSGPANLVVIADTDLLSDRFWTHTQDFFGTPTSTPFADNGAFVTNLVSTLAGGDALLGLRGRGNVSRPFDRIDAMQRDADTKYRETADALTRHLDDTTKKLDALRSGRDGTQNAALDDAQRQAADSLRQDMLDTRGKLRAVQLDLRRDIASLRLRLELLDIAAIPAVLLVLSAIVALWRRLARRRHQA